MTATVGLFLSGAWFGYHWVLPGAMVVLIQDMGKNFSHMITIEDYTGFFLAVILGLGICFELPILIFFLSLFGIVDAKFLIKHIRYAILIIFSDLVRHLPAAGPHQHVPVRQPDAGALPAWRRYCMVRASSAS